MSSTSVILPMKGESCYNYVNIGISVKNFKIVVFNIVYKFTKKCGCYYYITLYYNPFN